MASITGLQSGEFTDIDVIYSISIDGDAGQNGQVLSSDGTNTLWINGSSIDREDLTAADTTITISGDGTYDGQVARTIQTNKVPNAITFATDGSGSRTGTFDGSSAITIDNRDNDNQLSLVEQNGIVITDLGGYNRGIATDIDADTIVFNGTEMEVAKVPNAITFATDGTGSRTGTFDGSSAITIDNRDTDTQLNLTEGNGITITNTGGLNRTIALNADGTTLSDNVGSGQAGVLKVPNALTAGTNLNYTSGTTFDGSSARTVNLDGDLTGIDTLTFTSTSSASATALTGNNYPAAGYQTPMTYFNLLDSSNIISPYFLHDVYDPSSADVDSLSTSFTAIFSSNLKNSFTAQSTSCCIELLLYNYAISSNRWLYLQLGDNALTEWSSGTSGGGYGTGTRGTARTIHYADETDRQPVRQTWYLQGLSVGTNYTINPMARTSSTTNYIYAGGAFPACILRGYYI